MMIQRASNPNLVVLPLIAILLDRLVTVAFWEFEANPLVSQLGILPWIALTLLLVVGMAATWYRWELHRSRVAVGCVLSLSALYGLVVVLNLFVVTGLL